MNNRAQTEDRTHTCTDNANNHLICCLGQELRQAFAGQLTVDIMLPCYHTIEQHHTHARTHTYTVTALLSIFGIVAQRICLAQKTARDQRQTEENNHCRPTQSEKQKMRLSCCWIFFHSCCDAVASE